MESQPQNPEFRINPENSHLCTTLPLSLHLIVWVDSLRPINNLSVK